MFKSILVPVSLAEPKTVKSLLETTAALSGESTQIRLLNVVEHIPKFISSELPGGYLDKAREEAQNVINSLVTEGFQGSLDAVVRDGSPATVILDEADAFEADLIVIGSHRPGLSDFLLGSNASKVVRHANCSVLVVR